MSDDGRAISRLREAQKIRGNNDPRAKLAQEKQDRAARRAEATAALGRIEKRDRKAAAEKAANGSEESKEGSGFLGRLAGLFTRAAETAPQENSGLAPYVPPVLPDATLEAKPVIPPPPPTYPLKSLAPELLKRCTFTLYNNDKGAVRMAISFADGTTSMQIEEVEEALERKRWGTVEELTNPGKGFAPQVVEEGDKTLFKIRDARLIVSLMADLIDAGAASAIRTARTFDPKSDRYFTAAMALQGITQSGAGAKQTR